jgi:hypothetical protein
VTNKHRESGKVRQSVPESLPSCTYPTGQLVLYDPLRSFSVLVLNFQNFGLQFPCANVTLHLIQINQGARSWAICLIGVKQGALR